MLSIETHAVAHTHTVPMFTPNEESPKILHFSYYPRFAVTLKAARLLYQLCYINYIPYVVPDVSKNVG